MVEFSGAPPGTFIEILKSFSERTVAGIPGEFCDAIAREIPGTTLEKLLKESQEELLSEFLE